VLIERIVTVLPITGAGVTLITEDLAPRYVAASDEAALRFEQLQTSLGQGPCLTAYATGQPVALADLTLDEQYPEFAPAAVAEGLAAAFTFPLHHGEQRLGALDLYRSSPGTLRPWAWEAAQTLADVASAYLLNAEARVRRRRRPTPSATSRCTMRSPACRTACCSRSGWSTPPTGPRARTAPPPCCSSTSTASSG
jgi:GAF domain-containing protein